MATDDPFILSKRKDSPYYQVRFKNPDKTSKVRFFPAKSTKETSRSKAIVKAWEMFNSKDVVNESFVERFKKQNFSDEELKNILQIIKNRGLIESYISKQEPETVLLEEFLCNFWDYENSPYIKEKRRMNKHIGVSYVNERQRIVKQYWVPYFKDRYLQSITKKELKGFIDYLSNLNVSWNRKQKIFMAGATAIRWAYNDELIPKDVTAGIISFSGTYNKRKILTKETAELLFSIKWTDEKAQLANIIAMLTGMRAGEILAIRKQDLGKDCIYVNHSWNPQEKLKLPKNGERRVVFFPFPKITNKMLELISQNPLGDNMDSFVFWAERIPSQPIDVKRPLKHLHIALQTIGFSPLEAKEYCFHSWRHFYASYMSDTINQRILQTQTGHKSLVMLEHYEAHQLESDKQKITETQLNLFSSLVDNSSI